MRALLRTALVLAMIPWLSMSFSWLSAKSDNLVFCGITSLLIGGFVVYPWIFKQINRVGRRSNVEDFPNRAAVLLACLPLLLAGCTRVGVGYAGIKVNQWGTDKGVETAPLVTGMVTYNPFSTDIIEYPTFVQTATWTADDKDGEGDESFTFNSKEGMQINCDVSLSYQLQRDKAPAFYVKYRADSLRTYTHGFLHNTARDSFNETAVQYTVEQLYGEKKEEFMASVKERINKQVNDFGIEIQQFGLMGPMRLPETVVKSLNAKIQATQDAIRVENELRSAEAEAKKRVATAQGEALARITEAEGRSKANRVLQESITGALLQWRALDIQQQALEKWNGALPVTMMGEGGVPFIQIQPGK